MMHITESKTIKRKIKVLPCIECRSENIDIGNRGYSSFNVAWGKCKKCGNETEIKNCSWDISKETIVKHWNTANDPKKLKVKYEKQIKILQKKIHDLPVV